MGLTVNQVTTVFGGANPSSPTRQCRCSSVVEHSLGKGKVEGSILSIGSRQFYLIEYKEKNMATKSKKKKFIKLVCQECKKSVYFTKKTKAVEDKLQLSKFCKYDKKHTNHKEVKR